MANKEYDSWLDAYEVGKKLCGLDDDLSEESLEEAIYEKYLIAWANFEKLIEDLAPLCQVGTSPLTGENYRGFADVENGLWLAKRKIT